MLFQQLKDAFGLGERRIATERDLAGQYARDKSLVDMLPWCEFLEESKQILFADGKSRMGGFDIETISTDGRSQDEQSATMKAVSRIIGGCMPEVKMDPWVIQLCYSTEVDYEDYITGLREYVKPAAKGSAFTEDYLNRMEQHMAEVHAPGGYFFDKEVTKSPWIAKSVRVRIVAYRRYWRTNPKDCVETELEDVLAKISSNLDSAGIKHHRLTGEMFYRWMRGWFNPAPAAYGGSVTKMLKATPWATGDAAPFGRDMAEVMFGTRPRSDDKLGFWYFDELPHCAISLGALTEAPKTGQFTGEIDRGAGDALYAMTDKLPEGTQMVMTITGIEQAVVKKRIKTIAKRASQDSAEGRLAIEQAEEVLDKTIRKDPLFPVEITLFVRGKNNKDLQQKLLGVKSEVDGQGITAWDPTTDPLALDTYIKNLPGVFIPEKDQSVRSRARLYFASHAAALSPIWGRAKGTGNPGISFFNRGAEVLSIDPLSDDDRKSNSHGFIMGTTGSGKSATVVSMLMQIIAVHRPRIYIIEAGNSFGLFAQHARRMGLTVNSTALSMGSKVSIPPFSELYKIAEQEVEELKNDDRDDEEEFQADVDDYSAEEPKRNRLGEAYTIVKIMITGGETKEEERLIRPDKGLIKEAIIRCAIEAASRPEGVSRNVKPSQIQKTFIEMSEESEYEPVRDRLRYLGDSMKMFIMGLNRHLFERDGETWPEADITIVNMAQATGEDDADTLSVAYASLMLQINGIVERDQYSGRKTIILTDEAHLILKNPMLAPAVVSITKMWRKLGACYWVATQDMKDFQGPTVTLLNMMEFWWMLYMKPKDVEEVSAYFSLTEAKKKAMLQCKKLKGRYTEGIMMNDTLGNVLFRNVPPPLALALAQTDPEEKAARRKMMEKHGISELNAAYMIADQMVESRREEIKKHERN